MNRPGCLLGGTLLLLTELLACVVFVITAGHFVFVADTPAPSSAVVILGGDEDRVQHGVDLFNAGYASNVVFSGGRLVDAGIACSSTELSLEAARQLGLPTEAIIPSTSSGQASPLRHRARTTRR